MRADDVKKRSASAPVQSQARSRSLNAWLAPLLTGPTQLAWTSEGALLTAGPSSNRAYTNAQLDDYREFRARDLPWRPPLRLRLRARASHAAWPANAAQPDPNSVNASYLGGTAGFGFWNGAPSVTGGTLRLPESVWFFAASPPSNMALTPGVPGYGWKAQVVHSSRWGALAAIPPMAASAVWANLSGDERSAARWLNRLTGAREALIAPSLDLRDWRTYEIEWRETRARFLVDDVEVFVAPEPPRGPLGFVTWIDNQYAIATPRGRLSFGVVATEQQWLELADVSIQPL